MIITNFVTRNMALLKGYHASFELRDGFLFIRREDHKFVKIFMTSQETNALIVALGGAVQLDLFEAVTRSTLQTES